MDRRELARRVTLILKKRFPGADCALHHKNSLQLLVATILSAQCTDKRVNIVTKELFKKYKKTKDYADVPITELEKNIKSTGFYRNKAKNIKNTCKLLVKEHNGRVPDEMEELLKLPGVARKTANVVLGVAFKKAEGIVVDTHVTRISNLLELTKTKNAVKIEKDLMGCVPKKDWINFSHLLILHGRETCIARRPKCSECLLKNICPHGKNVLKK